MSQEARRKGHQVPEVLKERRGSAEEFVEDAKLARASHAEKALALLERLGTGVLSTIQHPTGYPFGSIINFTYNQANGDIHFFASKMAEHYENLRHDGRCSIIVSETQGEGDRLATARATFVGKGAQVEKTADTKQRFLVKHPGAHYVHFDDFVVFRFQPESLRYIGGFGEMSWVRGDAVVSSRPDPITGDPRTLFAVKHMNEDHAEANLNIVKKHAFAAATKATMLDVDRFGMTFLCELPEGRRRTRVNFPKPLSQAGEEVQHAIVAMSKASRL